MCHHVQSCAVTDVTAATAAAAAGVAKATDAPHKRTSARSRLSSAIGCSYVDGKLVISPATADVDVI